jgi:hypothetical protein
LLRKSGFEITQEVKSISLCFDIEMQQEWAIHDYWALCGFSQPSTKAQKQTQRKTIP